MPCPGATDAQTRSPTKTAPTMLVSCAGLPDPTIGVASPHPDGRGRLQTSLPLASAAQTRRRSALLWSFDLCTAGLMALPFLPDYRPAPAPDVYAALVTYTTAQQV